MHDLHHALRSLARHRGFTATALLVLTLGTTAAAVIFSLVNGVFLKPMPFASPEQLVDLNETAPQWNQSRIGIAWPDFAAWRERNTGFSGMAVLQTGSADLTAGRIAERVNLLRVSHDLTEVLGIKPVLGRGFVAGEDTPAGARVALLGHLAWQNLFGSDPDILGRTIAINREAYTIVGVLPRAAAYPNNAALWVPSTNRSTAWSMMGVGRLKPGVTLDMARAELTGIHRHLVPERKDNAITAPVVTPLRESQVGRDAQFIGAMLFAGVLVVLLVACGNVAAMMVARGFARRGETAVRVALGASPASLARPVVIESFLLCTAAGGTGLLAARWILDGLLIWLPARLPAWVSLEMDLRFAVGFAAILAIAAVVCALLPVRLTTRHDDLRSLIANGTIQSTAGAARFASLRVLVIGETAFAVALLMVALLLTQAMQRVLAVDPGFSTEKILVYDLRLTGASYKSTPAVTAFYSEHLARVRALPGVAAVSGCTVPPLSGHRGGSFFEPADAPANGRSAPEVAIAVRHALPGYFGVMRIPLVAGRAFDERDGNRVAIVDEALARRFWPEGDAVGQRLRRKGSNEPWIEVVGVARNVPLESVEESPMPSICFPFAYEASSGLSIVVKFAGRDADALLPSIRAILRSQDPGLVMSGIATMDERLDTSRWLRRFYTSTLVIFAGSVLLLVAVGLFGVVSYIVQQRTREIGIRMALGAQAPALFKLVLREALSVTAVGAAIGGVAGLVLSSLLHGLLFGVNPLNPIVLAGPLLALGGVVLAACLIPAWRAIRVNPVEALRAE